MAATRNKVSAVAVFEGRVESIRLLLALRVGFGGGFVAVGFGLLLAGEVTGRDAGPAVKHLGTGAAFDLESSK